MSTAATPILSLTQVQAPRPITPAARVARLQRSYDKLEDRFAKDLVALSLAGSDRERERLMLKVLRDHAAAHVAYRELTVARREAFAQ